MTDRTFPWWHLGYRWFCFRLWLRERPDKIAWWIAWRLPRPIALLAFVRVYSVLGECGPDYERAYTIWNAGPTRFAPAPAEADHTQGAVMSLKRVPAERTIAIAIVPPVEDAIVQVHVSADPNLWLRGRTNSDGYVSWSWPDSLGDSGIEIIAGGYEFYQHGVHWPSVTDVDAGPPPLNAQFTVGHTLGRDDELPPLVAIAPSPPGPDPLPPLYGLETGPIVVDRPAMRDTTGACWQWRGFSDFLLFYRFLTGVDIAPFLTERIHLGANVLRVFSMVGWDECVPRFYPQDFPGYYARLREFIDVCALRGVRVELVVFADAQLVMPDAQARKLHLTRVLDTLALAWNVFIEIANEPFKNLPGGNQEALDLAQLVKDTTTLLVASGEYDSWPPAPTADYGTTHVPRTRDWPRKCKDLMDRADNSGHTPWIGDEPMGSAEIEDPGRRDTSADNHAWYAAGSQMFGPGSTYHCDDGIHSRTPIGPVQTECAIAFYEALAWVPREALLWPYQRGDMGSAAGIGNMPILHDDAKETRSYCKTSGGRSWCVQIQTTREHATPRDGWRVVSEPRKGFVYLEKP